MFIHQLGSFAGTKTLKIQYIDIRYVLDFVYIAFVFSHLILKIVIIVRVEGFT